MGVDVSVVKDIRTALRRKYASRSNLDRIFNQWDKSKSGAISAEDLCIGLNQIGIKATLEDAIALKASAGQNDLTREEFGQLLFAKDVTLNVDLDRVPAPSNEDKISTFKRI